MSTTVKWSLNISVPGGAKLAPAGTIDIESYEVIDVDIDAAGEATLTLNALDTATFLVVTAGRYTDLTYEFGSGGSAVDFTAPLVLLSAAEVALLGGTLPETMTVTNADADNGVKVTALIGRDVAA